MKFGTIDISNTPVSIFMSKIIFIKYLAPVRPKLVPKLKVIRICWNLAYSIFLIRQPRFWCQKWFLWIIYLLLGPNWSQNQECSGLLKFGTFDISNIPISLLMSKIIFIKYLPLVRCKLVAKLKVLIIYWNLAHSIFQICQSKFWCKKWFFWNIYLLPVQIKPKLKLLRNLSLIFQVLQSWMRDLIKFHWTTTTCYAKIGLQVWIPISIIKCKVIFMKYTQVTSIIILKSL